MALVLLPPGATPAAEATESAQQSRDQDQQLGEVLVEGRRSKPKKPTFEEYQEPFDFLARLVGQFYVEGSVNLHAQGRSEAQRAVSGRAECVGFGVAPGVQCELRIRWPGTTGPNNEEIPGGLSTLNPAIMLFGFESADATLRPTSVTMPGQPGSNEETSGGSGSTDSTLRTTGPRSSSRSGGSEEPRQPGISYILIDSNGIAERATGEMATPNILRSRSRCAAIRGDCERVAQITALPDLKTVEINIDLVIDGEQAASFLFVLNRLPGSESVVYGRKDKKAR